MFELVGVTGATTQTGIAAGLNMFTWVCQVVFVWLGKRVGRRTIMLSIWPCLLLGLIGMCVATAIVTNSADGNRAAGIAG